MNSLKKETLRRQTPSLKGSNYENSNVLIPADVCGPEVRDTLNPSRDTQYDIRIHYQAQLIENCTPYGAGVRL